MASFSNFLGNVFNKSVSNAVTESRPQKPAQDVPAGALEQTPVERRPAVSDVSDYSSGVFAESPVEESTSSVDGAAEISEKQPTPNMERSAKVESNAASAASSPAFSVMVAEADVTDSVRDQEPLGVPAPNQPAQQHKPVAAVPDALGETKAPVALTDQMSPLPSVSPSPAATASSWTPINRGSERSEAVHRGPSESYMSLERAAVAKAKRRYEPKYGNVNLSPEDFTSSKAISSASSGIKDQSTSNIMRKSTATTGNSMTDKIVQFSDAPFESVYIGTDYIDRCYGLEGNYLSKILDEGLGMKREEFSSEDEWLNAVVKYINSKADSHDPIWIIFQKPPITMDTSVQARTLRAWKGSGFGMNPAGVKAFNADFDGDEANLTFYNKYLPMFKRAADPTVLIRGNKPLLDFEAMTVTFESLEIQDVKAIADDAVSDMVANSAGGKRIVSILGRDVVIDLMEEFVGLNANKGRSTYDEECVAFLENVISASNKRYRESSGGYDPEIFSVTDPISMTAAILKEFQGAAFRYMRVVRAGRLDSPYTNYYQFVSDISKRKDHFESNDEYVEAIIASSMQLWRNANVPYRFTDWAHAMHECGVLSSIGNPQFRLTAAMAKMIKFDDQVVNGYVNIDSKEKLRRLFDCMSSSVFSRVSSSRARSEAHDDISSKAIAESVKMRLGEDFLEKNILKSYDSIVPSEFEESIKRLVEVYNEVVKIHEKARNTLIKFDGSPEYKFWAKPTKVIKNTDGVTFGQFSEIIATVWPDANIEREFKATVEFESNGSLGNERLSGKVKSKGYKRDDFGRTKPSISKEDSVRSISEFSSNNEISYGGDITSLKDTKILHEIRKSNNNGFIRNFGVNTLICIADGKHYDANAYSKSITEYFEEVYSAFNCIRDRQKRLGKKIEDRDLSSSSTLDESIKEDLNAVSSLMFYAMPKIFEKRGIKTFDDFAQTSFGRAVFNSLSESRTKESFAGKMKREYVRELIMLSSQRSVEELATASDVWPYLRNDDGGRYDQKIWEKYKDKDQGGSLIPNNARKKRVKSDITRGHNSIFSLIADGNMNYDDKLNAISEYLFIASNGEISLTDKQLLLELSKTDSADIVSITPEGDYVEYPATKVNNAKDKIESIRKKLEREAKDYDEFVRLASDENTGLEFVSDLLDACSDPSSYMVIDDDTWLASLMSIDEPPYRASEKTGKAYQQQAIASAFMERHGGVMGEWDMMNYAALGKIREDRITPYHIAMALSNDSFELRVEDLNGRDADRLLSRFGITGGNDVISVRNWLLDPANYKSALALRRNVIEYSKTGFLDGEICVYAMSFEDSVRNVPKRRDLFKSSMRENHDWGAMVILFSPSSEGLDNRGQLEKRRLAEDLLLDWIIEWRNHPAKRSSMMDQAKAVIDKAEAQLSVGVKDVNSPEKAESYMLSTIFENLVNRVAADERLSRIDKSDIEEIESLKLDCSSLSVRCANTELAGYASAIIPSIVGANGAMSDEMLCSGFMYEYLQDYYIENEDGTISERPIDDQSRHNGIGALSNLLSLTREKSGEDHATKLAKRSVNLDSMSTIATFGYQYGYEGRVDEFKSVASNIAEIYKTEPKETRRRMMDETLGEYLQNTYSTFGYDFSLAETMSIAHFMIVEGDGGVYIRSLSQIDSAIDSVLVNKYQAIRDEGDFDLLIDTMISAANSVDGTAVSDLDAILARGKTYGKTSGSKLGFDLYLSSDTRMAETMINLIDDRRNSPNAIPWDVSNTEEKKNSEFDYVVLGESENKKLASASNTPAVNVLNSKLPLSVNEFANNTGRCLVGWAATIERKGFNAVDTYVYLPKKELSGNFSFENSTQTISQATEKAVQSAEGKAKIEKLVESDPNSYAIKESGTKKFVAPIGPGYVFVVADGTDAETAREIVRVCERNGWTIVFNSTSQLGIEHDAGYTIDEYINNNCPGSMRSLICSSGNSDWVSVDFFNYKNGQTKEITAGYAMIPDESNIVKTLHDSHPDFVIGDSALVFTTYGYNNLTIDAQSGTCQLSAHELFSEAFRKYAPYADSYEISMCDESDYGAISDLCSLTKNEIFNKRNDGDVTYFIDGKLLEENRNIESWKTIIHDAMRRYNRDVITKNASSDSSPNIVKSQAKPGDVVAMAKMTIRRGDSENDIVAYAPIIPWVEMKDTTTKAPRKFDISPEGIRWDKASNCIMFDWALSSDAADGGTIKCHSSDNPANKFVGRIEDSGYDYTLLDGRKINAVVSASTTSGRGYAIKLTSMASVMFDCLTSSWSFNIAEMPGFLPGIDESTKSTIVEKMMSGYIDAKGGSLSWDGLKKSKTRWFDDEALNEFVDVMIDNCLRVDVNPGFCFQTRFLDLDTEKYVTPRMYFDFKLTLDPNDEFYDRFLKFYNVATKTDNGFSIVPYGLSGDSSRTLYKVMSSDDPQVQANPLHNGALYTKIERKGPNGKSVYEHEFVVTDLSFYGEDFSGMTRPKINQSRIFPQSLVAASQSGDFGRLGRFGDIDKAWNDIDNLINFGLRKKGAKVQNTSDFVSESDASGITLSKPAEKIYADEGLYIDKKYDINGDNGEKTSATLSDIRRTFKAKGMNDIDSWSHAIEYLYERSDDFANAVDLLAEFEQPFDTMVVDSDGSMGKVGKDSYVKALESFIDY